MLSQPFKQALVGSRLRGQTMYQLALEVGLSPSTLSAMLHGARRVDRHDKRLIKLGRRLGLRATECFEDDAAPASIAS